MERRRGSELAQEVGRRIRQHREALVPAVSQERLADQACLHRTYIGHVERGEVNLTVYSLIRIATALGVDAGDLLHGLTLWAGENTGSRRDIKKK